MSRCKHPFAKLVFEGSFAASANGPSPFADRPSAKVQVFQCPHCQAVQTHVIQDGRVEVRPWSHYPAPDDHRDSAPATGIDHAALFPMPAAATILPFPSAPPPAAHGLQVR